MDEFQIFGPPGTGKTSRLATRDIPRAVEKFGPEKVLVTSFTRAGAREIATKPSRLTGESLKIPKGNVGTLHSLCFNALGQPKIAEVNIETWNERYPTELISKADLSSLDGERQANTGSERLAAVNIQRARLIPQELWHPKLKGFYKRWQRWKSDMGFMDFQDLIEEATVRLPIAPGNPDVLFVDEAQDFNPAQLKLARRWALSMKALVLVGDDDQCVYFFSGADPRAFLASNAKFKTILRQSYRVPFQVHDRAMSLISRVTERENKEYLPRDFPGTVSSEIDLNWKKPDIAVDLIKMHMAGQKTVMILGSCSYMLDPVLKSMKEAGIAFHNPYRRSRGDWNPLRRGDETIVSGTDLLTAFLTIGQDSPYQSVSDLIAWARHIRVSDTGLIRKYGNAGIKALEKAVDESQPGLESTRNVLAQIFNPQAINPILGRDVKWLMENIKSSRLNGLKYPVKVYEMHGMDPLRDNIRIIIGTIHSVKGGEADTVILFPDISIATHREILGNPKNIDHVRRLFYVGMTRAYENLVLTSPAIQTGNRQALHLEM